MARKEFSVILLYNNKSVKVDSLSVDLNSLYLKILFIYNMLASFFVPVIFTRY